MSVTGLILGCHTENDPLSDQSENNGKRPQTVFEGKWKWSKTDGVGIAGPYQADSTTVGYAMLYEFGYSELQIYRNDTKEESYSYSFTVSEKQDDQRLTLKSNNPAGEVSYLWEIKRDNFKNRLILRNVEPCCDNTFEQHFEMVEGPSFHGSK